MKSPLRIAAIDPGTRTLGIAVLDGEELLYHDVLTFRYTPSRRDLLAAISERLTRILRTYRPDRLAIERTVAGRNRRTAILDQLFTELLVIARREKIPVIPVSPSAAKKFTTGDGWATKEEVSGAIVARWYPELLPYRKMSTIAQSRFHENRFDAIAVGRTALGRLG